MSNASALAVSYDTLRREIGRELGLRSVNEWTVTDVELVDDLIHAGERKTYWPQLVGLSHEWRFLQPKFQMTTVADQDDYILPDDFGGLIGKLYYSPDDSAQGTPLSHVGEGAILALRQGSNSSTGPPCKYAIRYRASGGVDPQSTLLMLWPTSQSVYVLRGTQRIIPPGMSSKKSHPYGGTEHGELIRLACLAEAEAFRSDGREQKYKQQFLEQLTASIQVDSSGYRAEKLGMMRDTTGRSYSDGRWMMSNDMVTLNGQDHSE